MLGFTGRHTSPNGKYKLAFFTSQTGSRYLGISDTFSGVQSLWVANRVVPINDTNANLTMDANGVLAVRQVGQASTALNANSAAANSVATLGDSGNFVVSELSGNGSVKGVLWQSFDYPTDTLFPEMMLGKDFGEVLSLTSWLSDADPAPGAFSLEWDLTVNGTMELIMKRRSEVYWTSGLLERENRIFQNLNLLSENFLINDYQLHDVSDSLHNSFFYKITGDRNSWWKLEPKGRLWDTNKALMLREDICLGFSSATPGCHDTQNTPKCRRKGDKYEARTGYFLRSLFHRTDWMTNASLTDCWAVCVS